MKINTYKFSHARTALKYGLITNCIGENDQILLPSYICDVILYPLQSLGIKPIFYNILNDLSPDWHDLENKLNSNTKALMMVHYFGFSQNINKFQEFCLSKKILLIEDNAHGFGGTYQGKLLGTFGHIGFTSPRKTYPVFNGAYLYLSEARINIIHLAKQPRLKLIRFIKSTIYSAIKKIPHLNNIFFSYPNFASQDEFKENPIADWVIDEDSNKYLQKQNLIADKNKRVEIFKVWLQWALNNGLKPVFDACSDEYSPQLFPAYTKNQEESKKWFDWGRKHNIRISSWPRLPRSVILENGSAMETWEKLICFPIDLQMDPETLREKLCNLSGPVN